MKKAGMSDTMGKKETEGEISHEGLFDIQSKMVDGCRIRPGDAGSRLWKRRGKERAGACRI